jgi:hypothetical protein
MSQKEFNNSPPPAKKDRIQTSGWGMFAIGMGFLIAVIIFLIVG